jgi:hypothetical protein
MQEARNPPSLNYLNLLSGIQLDTTGPLHFVRDQNFDFDSLDSHHYYASLVRRCSLLGCPPFWSRDAS